MGPLRLDAEEILRLAKAFTHREVLDGERIVSQGVVQMGKLTSWGNGSLSIYLWLVTMGFSTIPGDCLGFLNHQQ